jgi:hypothetical protein
VGALGAARAANAANAAPARAPALLSLDDLNDRGPLLAKDDSAADPVTLAERTVISALGPVVVAVAGDGRGQARPVIHAAGTTIRARAVVAVDRRLATNAEAFRLAGASSVGALSFVSGPGRPGQDGASIVFELMAHRPLPSTIALVEGEIRWSLVRRYRRPLACGWTKHTVFVTAGPPLPARAWPITGARAGDEGAAGAEDHNAPTVARLRAAVSAARGARTATEAATLAWRAAVAHFSLDADPGANPWDLVATGARGQCMTTAALIESMVALLGFTGGSVVYVYPAFGRARAPGAQSFPHPLIRGAYTIEAPVYDPRGQLRSVAADPGHAGRAGALHRGTHGVERLKMRDFRGGLHNYAAAYVVEEGGARSYFGGGYSAGPYHDAPSFLAAACTAAVWTYERDEAEVWDTVCDRPASGYWWATGLPFRDRSGPDDTWADGTARDAASFGGAR